MLISPKNCARIRPTQRVVRCASGRVTGRGHRRLFVSWKEGERGERKPSETGNSNETKRLSVGPFNEDKFRVEFRVSVDRTSSKVFHHPLPPLCVFSSRSFVCIFVDGGACIINEASLDEKPSPYRAVTNSVEKESRIELCRIGHRLPGEGGRVGRGKWAKRKASFSWKTFD